MRLRGRFALVVWLTLMSFPWSPGAAARAADAPEASPRVIQVHIPAPSMRGNRVGQPDSMPIAVYLPPSYPGEPSRRYPVVYFLPGFGDRVRNYVTNSYGFALPDSVDGAIAGGGVGEMIVVVANGFNSFGGSFYARSSVTGDWEAWISDDVVGWVDAHCRTLARRESRGLAGHSMGGSGALRIGMHRPDVFGAVYAMSPGLFAPGGYEQSVLAADSIAAAVLREDSIMAATPEAGRMERLVADLRAQGWTRFFATAYGAAFSPDPAGILPCVRWPWTRVGGRIVRDAAVAKRWEAGFGDLESVVRRNARALTGLRALGVEYGTREENEWIPAGCRELSKRLDAHGVRHALVTFEGAHDDRLGERLTHAMLPFFARALARE